MRRADITFIACDLRRIPFLMMVSFFSLSASAGVLSGWELIWFIGPAGKMLQLMDRHPFRPAHIHIIVSAEQRAVKLYTDLIQATKEGYRPLTTQIFDRKDKYLTNDSVFAVKDSLVVDFVPRKDDPQAGLELQYDVKLVASSR